jgi:O-antigen ligase
MERLVLLLILVLAPQTKVPVFEWTYAIRPADFMLFMAALFFVCGLPRSNKFSVAVPEMWLAFLVSLVSVLWGSYLHYVVKLDTVMEAGTVISYLDVAIRKLLLIIVCFLGFRFVTGTSALSNARILQLWYRGLVIAVVLHALCYILTSNYFAVRAGVFVEGNHGGSYYLLSFFLMWFSQQERLRFGRRGMMLALGGVVLSQSSSALLLLPLLTIAAYLAMPAKIRRHTLRWRTVLLIFLALYSVVIMFSSEIAEKIAGEAINPSSFSRYDRLSSIASGINMFLDYPLLGVGIQGYAFSLPQYVDPFIQSFFDWNSRRIANNIYIELLSEQGLIGFLAMLLVIYRIIAPIFRHVRTQSVLAAGAVSILLSWMAFPTYTVSYHWIGFAVLVRLSVQGVGISTSRSFSAINTDSVPGKVYFSRCSQAT